MATAAIFNFKPMSSERRQEVAKGPKFAKGDLVCWTNPNTGAEWGELEVQHVYPRQGVCLVKGWLGRVSTKTGNGILETQTLRIDQLTLEARAGERV